MISGEFPKSFKQRTYILSNFLPPRSSLFSADYFCCFPFSRIFHLICKFVALLLFAFHCEKCAIPYEVLITYGSDFDLNSSGCGSYDRNYSCYTRDLHYKGWIIYTCCARWITNEYQSWKKSSYYTETFLSLYSNRDQIITMNDFTILQYLQFRTFSYYSKEGIAKFRLICHLYKRYESELIISQRKISFMLGYYIFIGIL